MRPTTAQNLVFSFSASPKLTFWLKHGQISVKTRSEKLKSTEILKSEAGRMQLSSIALTLPVKQCFRSNSSLQKANMVVSKLQLCKGGWEIESNAGLGNVVAVRSRGVNASRFGFGFGLFVLQFQRDARGSGVLFGNLCSAHRTDGDEFASNTSTYRLQLQASFRQ